MLYWLVFKILLLGFSIISGFEMLYWLVFKILLLGFSIISGFEMLYWLVFKILLHKKDEKAEKEDKCCDKCGTT